MLEHALDAGVHLLFFNELAAFCCCDAFFYGGKESRFVVQVADQNIGRRAVCGLRELTVTCAT